MQLASQRLNNGRERKFRHTKPGAAIYFAPELRILRTFSVMSCLVLLNTTS
jgi:hypothetical protein